MPNKRADPLADVMADVIASDDNIRKRMQKIVNALLDDMERTIRIGDRKDIATYTRMTMAAFLRSMQGADANADEAKEKAAYNRILAMARGEVPPEDMDWRQ